MAVPNGRRGKDPAERASRAKAPPYVLQSYAHVPNSWTFEIGPADVLFRVTSVVMRMHFDGVGSHVRYTDFVCPLSESIISCRDTPHSVP